jgi:hypothetical protein
VGDNIHGGDVSSENNDTAWDLDLGVGGGNGGFAEGLDDFLNTALEGLVDSSYIGDKLVSETSNSGRIIVVLKSLHGKRTGFALASFRVASVLCTRENSFAVE